ncbi:MAG: hypothetical protein RLY21_225 [Planctomycetota bacterium]|jgi:hypothetical protein
MTDTSTTRSLLASAALFALGAGCALFAGGCNIITPVAYAIEGPGKIDAEFTLPNKKTVVFVDDANNIFPRTALRASLGDSVSFTLMGQEVLSSTVPTRDAIAISRSRSEGNAGRLISIEAIGRALDCAQVIYIQPEIFDIAGRSDMQGIRPTAIARVKVIDIDTKTRVYPVAEVLPEGREVTATIREASSDLLRSRAGRTELEDALAKKLAIEISQLFYKHDRIDLGENLGTRKQ